MGSLVKTCGCGLVGAVFSCILASETLAYCTLETLTRFGGSGSDRATAIASDRTGNLFVTGSTKSPGLATPNAFQRTIAGVGVTGGDAFLAKLDGETLSPIWVTYLGGEHSENGTEKSGGIVFADDGAIFVAGTTSSYRFPVTQDAILREKNPNGEDLFLAKISADGSQLLYSTYLGGSSGDILTSFQRDADGNLYLAGITYSPDFPVTANAVQGAFGGLRDGFLLRLTPDGKRVAYGTYFGGSSGDVINAIAVRSSSEVWLAGDTSSTNFPTTDGAFGRQLRGCGATECDAFLASIDTDAGRLNFSTLLSSDGGETVTDLALIGDRELHLYGHTHSMRFPLTNWPGNVTGFGNWTTSNGFAMRFDAVRRAILSVSLFGGEQAGELVFGGAVIGDTDLVVGQTFSRDFPIASNNIQNQLNGISDGFLVRISSDGRSLLCGTYLGGTGSGEHLQFIAPRRSEGLTRLPLLVPFFVVGAVSDSKVHEMDPGPRGVSDILVSRWGAFVPLRLPALPKPTP
jgi:hypothetical protein